MLTNKNAFALDITRKMDILIVKLRFYHLEEERAMRRFCYLLVIFLICAGNESKAAKDTLFVKVIQRTGHGAVYEFVKYDKKKQLFTLKTEGVKVEVRLHKISTLAFDTGFAIPQYNFGEGRTDLIQIRNGAERKAILREFEKKKVGFFNSVTDRTTGDLRVDSVSFICFNPGVLSVDRMDYGKGFNLLDESSELELANGFADEIINTSPMLNDTIVDQYVDSLCKYIAQYSKRPALDYSCRVINSDEINAFTTGGGRVFIYRGLLEKMNSQSELGGVIAHEIGHIVGKHTAEQLSKKLLYTGILAAAGEILNKDRNKWAQALTDAGGALAFFSLMKYSRDDEREADKLGFYNLYEAGVNLAGMVTLFETFAKYGAGPQSIIEQWAVTHPGNDERRENVSDELTLIDADELIEDSDRFHWIRDYVTALPPPVLTAGFWVDTFSVVAGNIIFKQLDLSDGTMKKPRLIGNFIAEGGVHNDIRFLIFDAVNYVNWKNKNAAVALYDTDKTTIHQLDFAFPKSDVYVIVFDNSPSILTAKTVKALLYLNFTQR
ncbi:MAG: M48 family metalloprotease [candidate division Zixibacteria bacterium]|nr:M48 family metalloprotease [candidate division Zixibacteria bacterium]